MPVDERSGGRAVLRLAHSPDPDDAFMWWPLFEVDSRPPRLDTGRFRFQQVTADIESLNQRSNQGDLEITAISCAQYPHVKHRYALTACGASMGDAYGPKLVAGRPLKPHDLRSPEIVIAVPGTRTSAFAAATIMLAHGEEHHRTSLVGGMNNKRIDESGLESAGGAGTKAEAGLRRGPPGVYVASEPPHRHSDPSAPPFRHAVVPFEQIIERVAAGEFDAGLIIHEGQLTFQNAGLHLVADLGQWWMDRFGAPLPLGVNVIRRDLEERFGPGALREITGTLVRSVRYALDHREESVAYAMRFARDMSPALADEFIRLYVNKWTLSFGDDGQRAVEMFLQRTQWAGLTPEAGKIELIEPGEPVAAEGVPA